MRRFTAVALRDGIHQPKPVSANQRHSGLRGRLYRILPEACLRLILWRCCNVAQMNCRVCGCVTAPAADQRCRLCRVAKAATDSGTSYGKLTASLFDRYGELPDLPQDMLRTCPVCKRLFLPKRQNQVYDNRLCAQRAASKNYYERRRKDEGLKGSGRKEENDYGPNPSNQVGRRVD